MLAAWFLTIPGIISRLSCNRDSTPLTAGMAAMQLYSFTDIQLHTAAEEILFADIHILERHFDTDITRLDKLKTTTSGLHIYKGKTKSELR